MNELARQSGISFLSNVPPDMLDKFAELIVQECVDIAYKFDEPKLSGPGMIIGNRIEEHFGVGMSTEDKKTLIKELLGVKKDD
jgi:hypothetical protein